ncbi:MAG: class I SAM-dependent methyltransferase [Burkholderiales bacterium]|nr:class I SAM-dependent methyltransferase [Burkholderiales bacterium]
MQSYYAARATYYDAVYERVERAADIAFLREHLPARLAARDVLEVACGTGYWSQHLVRRVRRLVLTDAVAEPLALAATRPGIDAANCHIADAYAPPESLGKFNGLFAGLWFSHVARARRAAFFTGIHARLTPGARVLLIDNNEAQRRDFPNEEVDAQGDTYQLRTLRDGSIHRVLKNFPSRDELQAHVQAAGGRVTDYRNLDNFWLLEYELG